MAKKDTINALIRRGVPEEDAYLLVKTYSSLSAIAEAGVEGVIACGLTEERAKDDIAKIGKRPRSRSSKKKAASAKPEVEPVVYEEVFDEHVNTETENELIGIMEEILAQKREEAPTEKFAPLSLKEIVEIAERIDIAENNINSNGDLSTKNCAVTRAISNEKRRQLVEVALRMFNDHQMDQNESAGVMAAHSIGEPGTQMNLRTFHNAGVANITVTEGLPRLIEIVDARREPSTPSMQIPLKGYATEDHGMAKYVATNIEITTLHDVASITTDETNMRLVIVPDARKMDDRHISSEDVVEKLNKIKAVRGLVEMEGYDIVIASDEPSYKRLQQMYDAVKNAKLKGIDGIFKAVVYKNKDEGDRYSIVTQGSNLKEVLKVEGVDTQRVTTNSIAEVSEVLGIEAARNAIIREATSTLSHAGLDVDIRHIMLVADLMTNDGFVRSIGRHGVSGKKSSVLARAAFEITTAHLLHAAMIGEVDPLEGVTENIIVGQPVTLGTGAVNLIYTPKKSKEKGDEE